MNWVVRTLSTSVGKKLLMAVTGFLMLIFLAVHLVGNLSIYRGREAFVAYAEGLHALGGVLVLAEVVLALCLLIHVTIGTVLFFENRRARPVRYEVEKSGGGRTFSSITMPYTGLLILAFLVVHLATFSHHLVDQTDRTVFLIAREVFGNWGFFAFYLFSMVVVAFHIRHGLWSAFQTVGANHPKYMPFIEKLSLIFAIAVGVGFGSLPFVILLLS
jgi:succinate dehydrogenase / fumarate reductase cytochrome b subunit|uniref:Succinate dehydrogenase cytochrome b subunit n=1 Tax=Desulfobacca acetoxidans TaxID=60893 RepID=A0A7C3WHH8_9BACT